MVRRAAPAALVALATLAAPAMASAHATLQATQPGRGAELARAPAAVTMRFNEPVELAFGSVRVFDARGNRVEVGSASHPPGRSNAVTVRLRRDLPRGAYTATYRVVSADSHPVRGGFVFSVGRGSAAPAANVDELIGRGDSGPVTAGAFGVVRALAYGAIALAIGAFAFVLLVWRPALGRLTRASEGWLEAGAAFERRLRAVAVTAVGVGVASSALGIVMQGATAGGGSVWGALGPAVVGDVLDTRFGSVWAARLVAWVVVGALVLLPAARLRAPQLRPASLGATGVAPAPRPPLAAVIVLGAALGFIALTPALSGHAAGAGVADGAANLAHVLAMGVWVGGVTLMLAALPAATRALEPEERGGLLATSMERFSAMALAAVAMLAATGVIQSILLLESLSDLTGTAFGRAVLVKAAVFAALVALGALNRRRLIPRLRVLADRGAPPGAPGRALRGTLLAEAGLMAAVLGVTAALVSYSPAAATGPYSASEPIGPARLELTVDPARAGSNELHLYLFDRRTGAQFDRAKEVRIEAVLPEKRIGPIAVDLERAGPGHLLARRVTFVPDGEWRLDVVVRTSEFDEHRTRLELPVE